MQTTTYIFRILSILHPTNSNYYSVWFVLMLVAPLLTNAFVYMVMGRMVWNFSDDARVLHVRPWRFGLFFVILDVLWVYLCPRDLRLYLLYLFLCWLRTSAFFVQVGGAAMASGEDISHNLEKLGLHIYMAGVGAQQLFVIIFIICAIFFHRKILRQQRPDLNKALLLLYVQYVCLALITVSPASNNYPMMKTDRSRFVLSSVFVNTLRGLRAQSLITRPTNMPLTACLCFLDWSCSTSYTQVTSCQGRIVICQGASNEKQWRVILRPAPWTMKWWVLKCRKIWS